MTDQAIKRIVIVGGGTAGWMAASALSENLSKHIDIVLIESEAIGTVGVGEATIPNIQTFNRILGLDEADFMRKTQATFKLGIEFVDWQTVGGRYMHPFGNFGIDMFSVQFYHYWLRAQKEGLNDSFFDYSLACQTAPKLKFSHPKKIANSPLSSIKYAYHFDAGLYAKYLRHYAEKRGVTRIEGVIKKVSLNSDNGDIESVDMASGRSIYGDLFVDCSGFKGLLIKQSLGVGFESYERWLPCDRAVAMPCEAKVAPFPYTRSTATDAGWRWRIPLQHRIGNGHVYCSSHMSDDRAVDNLSKNLDGKPLGEPNFIRFQTGRSEKFWHKNCVALGLASGFLEPLESTSIHLIQSGIIKLLGLFPDTGFNQVGIDKYNKESVFEFERIRDFLILHYYLNHREETFWRACGSMPLPDSLQEKIRLFTEIGHCTRDGRELFAEPSWLAVMIGQGLIAKNYNHIVDRMPSDELMMRLQNIKEVVARSADSLPSHEQYLARFCASKECSFA